MLLIPSYRRNGDGDGVRDWDSSKINEINSSSEMIPVKYNVHTLFQKIPNGIVRKYSQKSALSASLMLFNLTGNLNVGMCIRTAAICGLKKVYIIGKRTYDSRSAVGAKNYIQIERYHHLENGNGNILEWFTSRTLIPVIIEQGGTDLAQIKFRNLGKSFGSDGINTNFVFIVGSESAGIPDDVLNALSTFPKISITQRGVIRSLNVSTATGIVLNEYTRQITQYQKDYLCID